MKTAAQKKWQKVIAVGILLITLPVLLKNYIEIPDFFKGFLAGAGTILELGGLLMMKRSKCTSVTE